MQNLALSAIAGNYLLAIYQIGSTRKTDGRNVVCYIWWRIGNRPEKKLSSAENFLQAFRGMDTHQMIHLVAFAQLL